MKTFFWIVTTILISSLPAMAQRPTVVDVPMSFYGNRPAIEVMVNGKGPFLFLIDTGAQGMARADASLVQLLNLSKAGQNTASDASAKNQVTVNEVRLETISIGKVRFHNVTAPSRNYNTATYLPHIDGILGFDLFSDYLLTLDYPNKRVYLERGALPKADGSQILPFETINGNQYIEIGVGNLKAKAMIDSGNIRAVDFPASFVKKLALASYPKLVGKGGGVSGEFELKEVRLQDTLSIGRFLFPEPAITFTDVYDEINIGSGLLREFAITFDQKNHRIRFLKARKQ